MKGMFLSSFYATRKQTYIYFIVAIIAAGYFAVFNPLMSSAMAGVMLITPITDNIKHEKDSRWMYYVSTLPVKRNDYIKSYFAFYLILFGASLMIGFSCDYDRDPKCDDWYYVRFNEFWYHRGILYHFPIDI